MQKTDVNNNTALAIVVIATAVVMMGGLTILLSPIQQAQATTENRNERVTICHVSEDEPGERHEITVTENAVDRHLAHGDSIGPCVEEPPQDKTPPTLTVPEDITVVAEAGAEGVVVQYQDQVSAEDDVDGPVDVTCTPESDSLFLIGTTTVNCEATDEAGNTGTASFTVTVNPPPDTTPPTLTVPGDMRVPGGGVITWEVTAQDDVDGTATLHRDNTLTQDNVGGDITLSCRPPSGSSFSSGVNFYTVSCTATDEAGNTATASFRIITDL
jgi:hypothetical protein